MFFLKDKGVILPVLLILLLFISAYVTMLFEAYQTNIQLYKQLEMKTEEQIHSFLAIKKQQNP